MTRKRSPRGTVPVVPDAADIVDSGPPVPPLAVGVLDVHLVPAPVPARDDAPTVRRPEFAYYHVACDGEAFYLPVRPLPQQNIGQMTPLDGDGLPVPRPVRCLHCGCPVPPPQARHIRPRR